MTAPYPPPPSAPRRLDRAADSKRGVHNGRMVLGMSGIGRTIASTACRRRVRLDAVTVGVKTMTEVLTQVEKTRRAELLHNTRGAVAMGVSLDEYIAKHERSVERWTQLFYAEMEKVRVDDPVEVLPAMMAKLEERAISEARRAAEAAAKELVATMLRKALA